MKNACAGAAAGALGGLIGSWAMVQFQHALGGRRSDDDGGHHEQRRRTAIPNDTDGTFADEPASMQLADTIAEPVAGRRLSEREKAIAGPILHYAFGAAVGAMYGAAAEGNPATTRGAGVPFGAAVWLAADEIGVPLAGFASRPTDYPLSRHAAALGSHLVFGLTVECVRRLIRGAGLQPRRRCRAGLQPRRAMWGGASAPPSDVGRGFSPPTL